MERVCPICGRFVTTELVRGADGDYYFTCCRARFRVVERRDGTFERVYPDGGRECYPVADLTRPEGIGRTREEAEAEWDASLADWRDRRARAEAVQRKRVDRWRGSGFESDETAAKQLQTREGGNADSATAGETALFEAARRRRAARRGGGVFRRVSLGGRYTVRPPENCALFRRVPGASPVGCSRAARRCVSCGNTGFSFRRAFWIWPRGVLPFLTSRLGLALVAVHTAAKPPRRALPWALPDACPNPALGLDEDKMMKRRSDETTKGREVIG